MKHKNAFLRCILCALLLLYVNSSFAQTPIIKLGNQTYSSLSAAIDAVTDNDYHITIQSNDEVVIPEEIKIDKSVTIEGTGGVVTLKTDAPNSHYRLFNIEIDGEEKIRLVNLILSGGDISKEDEEYEEGEDGGIIYLFNNTFHMQDNPRWGTLTLDNVTFQNAKARQGGAISTDENIGGWNINLKTTTFTDNRALLQGGALSLKNSNLTINDSKFTRNAAGWIEDNYGYGYAWGFGGGAIFAKYEELPVDDPENVERKLFHYKFHKVDFDRNHAYNGEGGAVSLYNITLTLTECKFIENLAGYDVGTVWGEGSGGGLHMTSDYDCISDLNVTSTYFTGNQTKVGMGGAMLINNTVIDMNDTHFDSNESGQGGALNYVFRYVDFKENNPVLLVDNCSFNENNTISYGYNWEMSNGGAINFDVIYDVDYEAEDPLPVDVVFRNSKFIGNTSAYSGGAVYTNTQNVNFFIEGDQTEFINNQCRQDGGAVFIFTNDFAATELRIEDVLFRNNKIIPHGTIYNPPVLATTRGYGNRGIPWYNGGAVFIESMAKKAEVINSTFETNGIESDKESILAFAGALYYSGCSNDGLKVQSSNFKENYIRLSGEGSSGGGGAISNGCSSKIFITGSQQKYAEFYGNEVKIDKLVNYDEDPLNPENIIQPEYAGGGALMMMEGFLKVKYVLFSENSFTAEGGGKYCEIGGGAVFYGGSNVEALFEKTTFAGNKMKVVAEKLVGSGGSAIFNKCTAVNLVESTLAFNTLDLGGVTGANKFNGGALFYVCSFKATIANSTITRNKYILPQTTGISSGGAGIIMGHSDIQLLNSIIVGNYIGTNLTDIQDILMTEEELPPGETACEMKHLKMVNTVYEKLENIILYTENDEEVLGNKTANVSNVFGGEPVLNKYTIQISEKGEAATAGTLTGYNEISMCCCSYYNFYFLKDEKWTQFECCDDMDPYTYIVPFDRSNASGNFGLTVPNPEYDPEDPCGVSSETLIGIPLLISQNNVDRLAYGHNKKIYNSGAYALLPKEEPTPEKPKAHLQWSVATSHNRSFTDVANDVTTSVTEPTPVYLQIRPVVETQDVKYDSWKIEYSVVPEKCYYPITTNISSSELYDMNNGTAHSTPMTYTYTATSLSIYLEGNLIKTFNFKDSPYTHTIVINKEDEPVDPPPVDPIWPPVLPPDPENPDPNPDAWIIIRPLAPFCYTEEYLVLSFDLNYKDKPLEYAVAFTESAHMAGFKDIDKYQDLPKDGVIIIPVNNYIIPGVYHGYVVLREKGTKDQNLYPFKVEVIEYVKITEHPVSHRNFCNGDIFTLSVEATGKILAYQWYYKKEKIIGANSDTYSNTVSKETLGDYFVIVTGYCNTDTSNIATVGMNEFRPLPKWDDMLYVNNVDNRFMKFQWYKDGQPITTYGSSIYYTEKGGFHGTYHVRAYLNENEYIDSCPLHYEVQTRSSTINIYPNPVNREEFITVESDEMGESYIGALVELYNLYGQKVYAITATAPRIQIPVTVPTGIYALKVIHSSGKVTTQKIIVK